VWGQRLAQYGLALAPEKPRRLRCRRYQKDAKSRLDFLGFTFFWGPDRTGKDWLQRRTARPRLKQALRHCTAWRKQASKQRRAELLHERNSQLRGYYTSYGVHGNASRLAECYDHVERRLYKWLNRRSQQHRDTWQGFKDLRKQVAIARPRMTESAAP
jgi:RNA-directed DNA polymerase